MGQVVGSRRKRRLETALVYAVLGVLVLAFVFPLIWVLGNTKASTRTPSTA